MRRAARIAAVMILFALANACATFRREPAAAPPAPKRVEARPAKRAGAGEPARKHTTEPLVEAFRCSMRVGPNLNTGIRVYSSLDGRENALLYGTELMDVPPTPNDHQLYLGAAVVVAGENGGTLLSFRHPRLEIEISVTHHADLHTPLAADFTDKASGALNAKGTCTLVSPITY